MPQNPHQQAMFIQSGDPESESVSSLYAPGQLGQRVTHVDPADDKMKQYQLVKTDSSMSVAPYEGAVAVWSDQANYVVTTDVTKRGLPAGVFRCAWALAGDYMFVQTKGSATVKYVDAPTAAPSANGLFVGVSGTAAKADCLSAAGTASTYPTIGKSTSVRNPLTSMGYVDLDVPETN
jgi:hypothetical protein